MAQRNALRNPRRTAATAAALMIGLALVTTVNVLGSSTRASLSQAIDAQLGADYIVQPQGQGVIDATAIKAISAVPGVRQAMPIYDGNALINGKNSWFAAMDESALGSAVRMEVESGSTRLGSAGMMVDTRVAAANGWQVGSKVPVRFADGRSETLTIVGIYAVNEMVGPRVIAADVYLEHALKPSPFAVAVNTAATDAATLAALEQALKDYPTLQVQDQSGFKEAMSKEVDGLIGFLTALLTMSIIIAAVGVVNTLALSVIERTREIGLLRAVGTSRRQLRRMIRLESVVIALFGALLGIGIGVVFGWAIQRALSEEGLNVLSVPAGTLVVYLVVAAVIGVLAALWPAWRAGRMDVLKAIATE